MSQQKKSGRNVELPDEFWELIFNRLGHHHRLEVISLVSKQFLSVSSGLKRTLTIYDQSIRVHCNIYNFFRRFHNISCIVFKCYMSKQGLNDILLDISRSGLDLLELHVPKVIDVDVLRELGSNMNNLATLSCGYGDFEYMDLAAITSLIPQLQVLNIKPSWFWRDEFGLTQGIEVFASKVKRLRKIDISSNTFVTDNLLIALSSNFKFLTELVVGSLNCQLTENVICFVISHCPNLTSLSLHGIKANSCSISSMPSTLFSFENTISHARALRELEFHGMVVSDVMLCSIAKARLPLTKLALWFCNSFTYSGLSFLLQEYQSINHLKLAGVRFLTDQMMNDLSMFLRNVSHLEIWGSCQLSEPTFYILTRKCPFLVELKLRALSFGQGVSFPLEQTENHVIRSLQFNCDLLNDESLKRFGLVCPNIQLLNLRGCSFVTEKGIGEILKSCSKLTHLVVDFCGGSRILGTGSEHSVLNLEVLRASSTRIDDKGMALIGTRCRGLRQLDLAKCRNVTEKGVKEVLENCVNLKVINLGYCCWNVNSDIVPWMMSARPSLGKITLPGGLVTQEEQRNFFLRYGCLVCNYRF